jgi:hypothetical protein
MNTALQHDPILAFKQFGFTKDKDLPEGHVRGHCPFCPPLKEGQSGEGHFFINTLHPNKTWDCKRCGRHGGFQMFLKNIVEVSTTRTAQKIAELADKRGLSPENLVALKVGWLNGVWTIPVFSHDNKTILNIKIYDGNSFKNTASCNAAMYGLWQIPKEYSSIYVCEGEWDYMALRECIQDESAAIIAVPGAGTFKQDCLPAFTGKKAVLLYDNDEAGKNGTKRAIGLLTSVASTVQQINWPADTPEGFDVRDVYTKKFNRNKTQAWRWLMRFCGPAQQGDDTTQPEAQSVHAAPVKAAELYQGFQQWLYLRDNPSHHQLATDLYDVIFGCALANRIPGPPVWLFIVAPPGGTKTEPLMAMKGALNIEFVDSVTPPALISGHGNVGSGFDPSMIPKFNGKLVVIKDYTAILGLPEFERKEIHNILRGGYDGECGRTFGNGIVRTYKSTFGILAAVTPAIEMYIEEDSAMGERFLSWRNWLPDEYDLRMNYIRKAIQNTIHEKQMKEDLNTLAKRVLLADYGAIVPIIDDLFMEQIIYISQWISVLRGLVHRDRFSKKVLHKPFIELGTRISKSLYKLSLGISLFKGHVSVRPDTMRIIRSVAQSSVSRRYLDVYDFIVKNGTERLYSMNELIDGVGLPSETVELILGNMGLLGALSRAVVDGKVRWRMREQFVKLSQGALLCQK